MFITIPKSDQSVNKLSFSLKNPQYIHFLTFWKLRDKVVQCEGYDPACFFIDFHNEMLLSVWVSTNENNYVNVFKENPSS